MTKTGPIPFLILWLHGYVTANVEPPANVTLHCHNLHNFVEWGYSQHKPGLQFKIDIYTTKSGDIDPVVVDSPTSQADLPSLPDITDSYLVTVTALFGQNESGPVPLNGIAFSYYNSDVEMKCILNFPPVNVTAKEDGDVLFSFTHPWILYGDRFPSSTIKTRRKKSHQTPAELPVFKYHVEIKNQGRERRLECAHSRCEGSVLGKAGQEEHCLTICGEMNKMNFKTTEMYCALPAKLLQQNNYTILIVAIVLLLAVALVLFMVYWKCTSPSSPLPPSMLFPGPLRPLFLQEERETVSVPEQEPNSPTPLLMNTQELATSITPTTEQELRLPIGVSTTDEDVCDVVDEERGQEAGYMPGHNLEDDDTDSSGTVSNGYEKRTCIVSLGTDEPAEGYRGCNAD